MKPTLIRFGEGLFIDSCHFMMFLGALVSIILVAIEIRRIGERPEKIYGLLILLLISAVYGAHILFWIDFRDERYYGFLDLLIFWRGGMALYGGVILAFIAYVIYITWQRLGFWKIGDMLTPPAAIFVFFARIGCFLAGCCQGRQCGPDFPLAVPSRDPLHIVPWDTPLYPTQLAFSASALAIFAILWARRRRKEFEGEIALIGVSLYSLISFVVEFFRGDPRVHYEVSGITLSQNQIIGGAVFLVATGLYLYRRGEMKAHRPTIRP